MDIPAILIADDDPIYLSITGAMVEKMGFKVISASDGVDAVKLFKKHQNKIEFVLLDMYMPNMDGETAFRHIRKRCQNVSVVVVSGSQVDREGRPLSDYCPTTFLKKPFSFDALHSVLNYPSKG